MLNENNASLELKEMMKNGYGFRNEGLYGSGVVDIREIIEFEIMELGNTDIIDTMKELYGLEFVNENYEENIDIILNFLENHFGTDELYGKWLCSNIEDVIEYYSEQDFDFEISKIKIPKDAIPISDLSNEGVLWVSKTNDFDELEVYTYSAY